MSKRRKWIVGMIAVLVVGLGYGGYALFVHAGEESLTVSELRLQAASLENRRVNVEGKIAGGSINWDSQLKIIRFVLTDDKEDLAIVYKGVVPDDFKLGTDLIVEGQYHPDDDIFEASSFGRPRSLCNLCH